MPYGSDVLDHFQIIQNIADFSIIMGGVMLPRLLVMFVDSLSGIFSFGKTTAQILCLLSPALIMNTLSGYSETVYLCWGLLFLGANLAAVILSGIRVFTKQDELNYGE